MAHMIETMAYAGATPWHQLGTKVADGLRDWRVMCETAGLNWMVEQQPLYLSTGEIVTHRANIRSTDGKVLGVVGPDYTVLQNEDAFEWFDPIMQAGEASFEAAGSLCGGSRVWALAKIDGADMEVREGDNVVRYILLSHAHDGTMCVRIGYTDVRVVCMNTLRAAHASSGSKLIRLRHTANVKANLDAVRDIMDVTRAEFRATVEQYRKLCNKGVNMRDVQRYVEIVLDVERKADERLATRTENRITEIIDLAFNGVGNSGRTMWDAYNAVTEYTTWKRGKSQDSRVNSMWFGDSAKLADKALTVALELAA